MWQSCVPSLKEPSLENSFNWSGQKIIDCIWLNINLDGDYKKIYWLKLLQHGWSFFTCILVILFSMPFCISFLSFVFPFFLWASLKVPYSLFYFALFISSFKWLDVVWFYISFWIRKWALVLGTLWCCLILFYFFISLYYSFAYFF